jgi:hypothetical protein
MIKISKRKEIFIMSKHSTLDIWNKMYGSQEDVYDYTGRLMKKSACGNPKSAYHPTLDHVRPLSDGGTDTDENIIICHRDTNGEKADHWPHWKANGKCFCGKAKKKIKNGYNPKEIKTIMAMNAEADRIWNEEHSN